MQTRRMSSGLILCVLVAVATCFTPANAGFWNWWSNWSEEVPTNCPHQNNKTHVCSTLESSVGVCITIDCCENFEDNEDVEKLDESESAGGSSEGHHGGHHSGYCSLCALIRTCDLYKCYRSCCEGYERDYYGRCTNKTGHLQCENGGVLRRSWWGELYCECPRAFKGLNCEIPKCKCENGGECIVKDGNPYCNCSFGYYGDRCETSNCTMRCDNGGKCYKYGDKEFCWCQENFIGNQCQQYYTNPDTCPTHDHVTDMCEYSCMKSSDCEDNHVCCKEGCSSVCRKVKPETCLHEGKSYAINSTYSPDPCTTCFCSDTGEMLCSSVACAYPDCLYGEPTVLPGQCCPTCPDKPNPPKIYNCPTSVVYLNTKPISDQAWLDDTSTNITARDSEGNMLLVKYRPDKVHHCNCAPSINSQTLVQAYAMDKYDSVATCSFNVIVKDIYPPRFKYCPKDITVSENEVIFWSLPDYEDNVGIARVVVPEKRSGDKFPVGQHTMSYVVWDHDGNKASCNFTLSVTRDPPRMDHCPTDVLHLNTSYYTDYAILSELSTGLQAFDSEDNKLQVQYEPRTVHHCRCPDSLDKVYSVKAMATDHYGKNVTCAFKVIVQDIYPPKFTYCPEDFSVSEGQTVNWKDPTYTDNVGIGRAEQVGQGGVLPVGKNTVMYNIWDHDGNKATCQFQVYVEERMPPKINKCPNEVLILNTPPTTDKVVLSESITSMTAYDTDGNQLEVNFQPSTVRHCHCYNSAANETLVEATARDRYGNLVTCSFRVVVIDQVKPVVTYCPKDISVVEYEIVTWRVEYSDNVEVARTSLTGRKSGSAFPVGNHGVTFEIWDFDWNSATCLFNVTVAKAQCTLECFNGGMCHRDSVTQVCRCPPNYYGKQCEHRYIHTYCEHEGIRYQVDETYSPDPCSTCTCVNTGKMACATVQCATPNCAGGRKPVSKPGHCCLECPEEPKPRISCPSHTVHVNTTGYSNKTMLDNTNTHVEAFDSSNQRLQVFFQPSYIHHCKCHNPAGHESTVQAHALDKYGSTATCSFKVIVRDVHPPKLFSCPESMYVFENEIVEWSEPKATDNVGVAGSVCTSKQNGKVFPLGEHRISCDIWDYERNKASCFFHVIVIKKDTPVEDMPLGHRERYTGHKRSKLRFILPPIFGAVALAAVAILLFCCCKRRCKPGLSQKKSHKPAKTENIYAEPGDIDSKLSVRSKRPSKSTYSTASSRTVSSRDLALSSVYGVHRDPDIRPPPYTLHPYSPPPYTISGSVKDVTYMSLPLPSYTNPEYGTLGVHRSSVYSPSVMSGSTVASRASKARSTKSSARSVRSSKSASSSYRA